MPKRRLGGGVSSVVLLGILLAGWPAAPGLQAAAVMTTLVSFNSTNGANPSAGLVQAADGNFYGTTSGGGAYGFGTVFRMTPWGSLSVMFSFGSTNGAAPAATLAPGTDGNLYGTTVAGGLYNNGTAFKVATNGAVTVLASFAGTNGAAPYSALAAASDGNLYGTTELGGAHGGGAAFQLTPGGGLSSLYSFDTNGYNVYAGLVQGPDGNFYGTTFNGGTNGLGTVFRLSAGGVFSDLHSFTGSSDGSYPYASLVASTDGAFYGTTFYGGSNGLGTLFRVTTNGVFGALTSFGGTNGAHPYAGLVQGTDGSLYGTTENGGAYTNASGTGYGTLFKVSTNGQLVGLTSFNGTNGAYPQAGLAKAADGSFYGTTTYGGESGNGTAFRLSLAALPALVIRSIRQTGGVVQFTWDAAPGERFQAQWQDGLDPAKWSNLGGIIGATNATMSSSDTLGSGSRFYRVVRLTP